jgi:hypothetical protein
MTASAERWASCFRVLLRTRVAVELRYTIIPPSALRDHYVCEMATAGTSGSCRPLTCISSYSACDVIVWMAISTIAFCIQLGTFCIRMSSLDRPKLRGMT